MAILIKLLPAILLIAWLWWTFTAPSRLANSLRQRSEPLGDWRLLEVIQGFARTLESRPFDVKVLDLEPVNAVALPTGEIYVWRGLYEKYLSGAASRDEVAAVIAHEIGHVALGHAQRRVETSRAQIAVWRCWASSSAGCCSAGGRCWPGWGSASSMVGRPSATNSRPTPSPRSC